MPLTLVCLVLAGTVDAAPAATQRPPVSDPSAHRAGARVGGAEAATIPEHAWTGKIIVGVRPGAVASAQRAVAATGGRVVATDRDAGLLVAVPPERHAAAAWIESLRHAGGVRYAEPDLLVAADDVTPNDPRWNGQPNMRTVGLPRAWETTTGRDDVIVAVLDTGVDYRHEDLGRERMWRNPAERVDARDNDANGFVDDLYGADCRNRDGDPADDNDHGTHVAGVIGAATNNATGIAGTAWKVRIMALKFLGPDARGSLSDAIRCLDYAVSHGADIVNASWGGFGYSQAMSDAVERARAAGVLFVASAGNDGRNTDATMPHYPSSYEHDNVVSVAASSSADGIASFSNYGPMSVDLAAPGVGIVSTVRGNGYAAKSGTSMAAPHVAGAAALVVSAFPGISYRAVADRLSRGVDRPLGMDGKVASGGRLNVARSVEHDARPPAPPSLWAVAPLSGRTSVALAWTAPADDGDVASGAVAAYRLRYRLAGAGAGDGDWTVAPAPWPAAPGTPQTADIPGLRPGRTYEIMLTAVDNAGNSATATTIASTQPGEEVLFEGGDGGPGWAWPAPWTPSAENAHGPSRAWNDSPAGLYASNLDVSVVSPAFSLASARSPALTLWQRYRLEQGRDAGSVEISADGGPWLSLATATGGSGWSPLVVDLSPFTGVRSARLRLRLVTDGAGAHDGWQVDDIVVSSDASTA